jgi:hypothetical protein
MPLPIQGKRQFCHYIKIKYEQKVTPGNNIIKHKKVEKYFLNVYLKYYLQAK